MAAQLRHTDAAAHLSLQDNRGTELLERADVPAAGCLLYVDDIM